MVLTDILENQKQIVQILLQQRCQSILGKADSQRTEQERDFIKDTLKQTILFKQLYEQIKFQQEEQQREISHGKEKDFTPNNQIQDLDAILSRTQRNIKYMCIPNNEFLFHKGQPGDRLYIIIKGHASVYIEKEKALINQELSKEKNLSKQISLTTNKILHYEQTAQLKEKKIKEDLQIEEQLQTQIEQSDENNSDNEIEQTLHLKKQRRMKEESALAQIKNTIKELGFELEQYKLELNCFDTEDKQILKQSCQGNKELLGKYFASASSTGNISYYTKVKTLDPFNHLGEASIVTNENRTATVMACSAPTSLDSQLNYSKPTQILNDQIDCESEKSEDNIEHNDNQKSDEDLHLLYLDANIFVGIFQAALDQINFPLTTLSKFLTHTSKDLLVRISYLFQLNEHKYNSSIFSEGLDYANCVYLVKRGTVQLQKCIEQNEADLNKQKEDSSALEDDCDKMKMKRQKKNINKKQIIIASIGEGQFFGTEDISYEKMDKHTESNESKSGHKEKSKKRTCSAIAKTNCLIYALPRSILFSPTYQLQELQEKLSESSRAKSQFYLNQSQKNNNIHHYLEKEMNRLRHQPQVDKTIIEMSMNQHKQLIINNNKISNQMDSFIKTNKLAIDQQQEILEMAQNPITFLSDDKNKLQSNDNNKKTLFSSPNFQYGRVQRVVNRNTSEIVYAHLVQKENEKALNIQQNATLSIMPQSQKSVTDIIRAQRNYSKTRDTHNKNIRSQSRQNMNDTIFVSQVNTNVQHQNQPILEKQQFQASSLCEFDDTMGQTNSQYKIERKHNMIQVKKIKRNYSSLQNLQENSAERFSKSTQKVVEPLIQTPIQSFQSITISKNQNVNNYITNMNQQQLKNKSIHTSKSHLKSTNFSTLNTPPIFSLQFDTDNLTPLELNEVNKQQLSDKKRSQAYVLNSLSSFKDTDTETKQSYSQSQSLPKYSILEKRLTSRGDQTERITNQKPMQSNTNQNTSNESFQNNELAKCKPRNVQRNSIQQVVNDTLDESDESFKQQLQYTKITPRPIHGHLHNSSSQNYMKEYSSPPFLEVKKNELHQTRQSPYFQKQSNNIFSSTQYKNGRSHSQWQQEVGNKYVLRSPLQIPSHHSSVNSLYPQKQQIEISNFQSLGKGEPNIIPPLKNQQTHQSQKQLENKYYLSHNSIDEQEQGMTYLSKISSLQNLNQSLTQANESRMNRTLKTPSQLSLKKNGKLKPLLPTRQQNEINIIQDFNPFQSRSLLPTFTKMPAY